MKGKKFLIVAKINILIVAVEENQWRGGLTYPRAQFMMSSFGREAFRGKHEKAK